MIPRELEDLLLTNNLKNIFYGDDTADYRFRRKSKRPISQ